MKRTQVLLTTLAVSAALGLSGCGGGDKPAASPSTAPTTAASAISTADFTTQANAVCAAGNQEIQTAADALGDNPTQEQIESFATDTLVVNIQGQHDGIEALGAPAGSEDDVTAMLDALQTGIDAVKADPSTITGDTDPFGDANDRASQLGLTDCTG